MQKTMFNNNNLPQFYTYCENTNEVNALCFTIGTVDVYFSYKTPIAFRVNGTLTIRVNDWSNTTGKHLNAIDTDKKKRINGNDFEAQLDTALSTIESRYAQQLDKVLSTTE
jgi:hypothetical protein